MLSEQPSPMAAKPPDAFPSPKKRSHSEAEDGKNEVSVPNEGYNLPL